MTTARGCMWEVLSKDSLVVTYCDDAATAEQWSAYLQMMQDLKGRGARHLVYCSAVPPREVLAKIATTARGQPWLVALVSPSTAVRFAGSTFSMAVRGFRFFSPDRIHEALQHLQCNDAEQEQASSSLARCRGIDASLPPK